MGTGNFSPLQAPLGGYVELKSFHFPRAKNWFRRANEFPLRQCALSSIPPRYYSSLAFSFPVGLISFNVWVMIQAWSAFRNRYWMAIQKIPAASPVNSAHKLPQQRSLSSVAQEFQSRSLPKMKSAASPLCSTLWRNWHFFGNSWWWLSDFAGVDMEIVSQVNLSWTTHDDCSMLPRSTEIRILIEIRAAI